FEDNPGNESVEMHSEKDMKISVENDKYVTIDGSRSTVISKDQSDDVTGKAIFNYHNLRTTTVDMKETEIFKNGQKVEITNGREFEIKSGGDDMKIKGNRKTTITGDEEHHVTGVITQNFDNGLITNINKGGKSEVITDGGLSVHVDGGDWVQKVQNGKIDISSPNAVHIKSDSSVTIDAPTQLVTAKGYNIAFTGISISGTGKSISMNAVSTS
ncbi:ImpA family type VI secretion-associated protein, partial [Klebsiella aerogenes]